MLLHRRVDLLHPPGHLLQLLEQPLCPLIIVLQHTGGQGDRQAYPLQCAGSLSQLLQESQRLRCQVAVANQYTRRFGGVLQHLVHQDEERLMGLQKRPQRLAAGRRITLESVLAPGELLCHQPPDGLHGPHRCAHDHHPLSSPFRRLVVHGDQRVGLATAEGGLDLDHRVTALPVQPLFDHVQQVGQSFGQIGFLGEPNGVSVLIGGAAHVHLPQVGGEHIHR